MVVCKYFLEGYCRFGDQCRYDHVNPYEVYDHRRPNFDRPSGTSVLKASSISSNEQQQFSPNFFQSPQQNKPPAGLRINIQELMQVVSKDLLQAEKGNQWLLTCYSPLKDLINIPDLVDYSPEELRWEYYIANQNGRLPLCQAIVQKLYANAAKVNNKLKKKDTAYLVVERWLQESEAHLNSQQGVPSVGNSDFVPFGGASAAQVYTPSNTQPAGISTFSFSLSQQQPISPLLQQLPMSSLTQQQPMTSLPQQQPMGFQPQPASGNVFGGSQMKVEQSQYYVVDNSSFSLPEELSESELEAFRANRFVFGCIPTQPPTREMCGL